MKTCLNFSVIILLSTASLNASAEEFSWGSVNFQPRAYAGYADYQLKSSDILFIDPRGNEFYNLQIAYPQRNKIDFSGLLLGIGGTVAYGRFFGDIYYQSTLNNTAYSAFEQQLEPTPGVPVPSIIDYGSVDAQHSDWALSLGYMITDEWSVFAGYKSGKTEWDQSVVRDLIPPIPEVGVYNLYNLNAKFDQDGPFLGTSYSFLIGSGALTFKAAYAYLDGTYDWGVDGAFFKGGTPPYKETPYTINSNLDGNSDAFSLGVSWTQSLADNLGYSLGFNYHRYKFDMSGTTTQSQLGGEPVLLGEFKDASLTEELFTITASVFYRF